MATFSAAAKLLASSFETKTRDDGSSFVVLISDSPEWIKDAVREAHDGELPNDTRYSLIQACAQTIADQDFSDKKEAEEVILDMAGVVTPCQTYFLLLWFSANTSRLHDCDSALEECPGDFSSVFDALDIGYRYAADLTLRSLIESIEDARHSIFNPDTDCRLLISDNQGIYIPQLYCQQLTEDDAADYGVEWADVVCCQSGPDQEWYWESWQTIIDTAEITEPATLKEDESVWRLYQSGDLWMVRSDVELPADF